MNPGVWSGSGGWAAAEAGPLIESVNPTTGSTLARVRGAIPADYERVIASAVEAARHWRAVPAPSAAR